MITLSKHIEYLLLDNDCVIVPDLGGFIAHYQASYFDESSCTFTSPKRVIGFNPKLTMNDGLLVQSYMQSFQTDFSDANKRIEDEVCKLKDKLYNDGSVEIPKIGTLSLNIENDYKFVPTADSIGAPTLYGLSSFYFNKIDKKNKTSRVKEKELRLPKENKPTGNNIGYKWAVSIVGVAVAFIMFFFLSVPVENSYTENDNYAYLGDAGLISSIKSKSFVTSIISNVKGEHASSVSKSKPANRKVTIHKITLTEKDKAILDSALNITEPQQQENNQSVAEADKPYHVIISTFHTEKAAEKALNDFQKRGYKDISIVKGKNIYRLTLCNFADKSSAYNKMNELKSKGEFKDSWVMCSK